MDLGEHHVSTSGRSSPSRFHILRRSVESGNSEIPLLAYNQQDGDPEQESAPANFSDVPGMRYPLLNGHERRFSSRKQLVRLLYIGLMRFIITTLLIGGIYGTIYFYKAKPIMSERVDKVRFDFCTTGLSMLLGISISSGLKQISVDIRWYILSLAYWPLSEVNTLLNVSSLTKLLYLAWSSFRKRKVVVASASLSWVLLNIAGQASVAALTFTYSSSPIIVPFPSDVGPVMVSNLSSFAFDFAQDFDAASLSFRQANQLAAHTYGDMSLTYSQLETNNTDFSVNPIEPNSLHSNAAMNYWVGPQNSYLQYVFQQWSYDGNSPLGQFYSNRSIAVSSVCTQFDVKEGADGSTNDIQYENSSGQMITRNFKLIQPHSTTYYTNADATDCGPRCANVCAFENNGAAGFYYECEVTFSNVTNTYDPAHIISDDTARMAAGSIALQGYQSDTQYAQYQRYPQEYYYGMWLGGNNAVMEYRMKRFAIGAIVGADQNNPAINYTLTSPIPSQGVIIKIDKPGTFHAILIGIAALQLLLCIVGAWYANQVIVLDESYISISNILKPLLKDIHDGSLLKGDELCDVVGKEKTVAYGSAFRESEKGQVRYLRIESDSAERRFPEGWYN